MMQENQEQTSSTSVNTTTEAAGNSPDYDFTTDDIVFIVEMLARIAHKWEEMAISLRLPKVARVECGRGSSLQLKLHNVIEKWIEGQYSSNIPTNLQSLKNVLAGPIVNESALACEVRKKVIKKVRHSFPRKISDTKMLCYGHNKDQLITRYLRSPEVPCDFWPPVGTKSFINLALIKSTRGTNKLHYSVRGDADDILETKEKIEYDEVFGKYESGLTVLVLGRPGSGKTTLVHKVCKDWSKEEALTEAELVFLISLRVVNTLTDHSSLAQLLRPYYFKQTISEDVTKKIEEKYGKGVCIILDGFDEYLCSDERNSVVYALLNKSYLPQAMVIITSRPAAASARLHNILSFKRIETFGFTKEQTYEYIDNFSFSTSSDSDLETHCSNLKAYLNINPQVLHMCYLPVNTAIICFVYDNEPNNMPQTQTKIYETFTRLILLRHLIRTESSKKLRTLEELTGEDARHFYKICQLAYDMTINSQQVISQDNVDLKDTSLGLATIDITASVSGFQNTYTFLHLTLQEFLAAYHIARLPLSEQVEIINKLSEFAHMSNAWKFYFGLVNFEKEQKRAKKIFSDHSAGPDSTIFKLQCAHESRQEVICELASSQTFTFYDVVSASDMCALAYVMSTTAASYKSNTSTATRPTTELILSAQDDDKVMTLFTQLSDEAASHITNLNIVRTELTSSTIETLANRLKHGKRRELKFDEVHFDVHKIKALHVLYRHLKYIRLSYADVRCDSIEVLASGLSCTQIQNLDLHHNSIGDNGIRVVIYEVIMKTNLQTLCISYNDITYDGAMAMATALTTNTTLQHVDLSGNDIGTDGAMALLDALVNNTTLLELGLAFTNIGSNGSIHCEQLNGTPVAGVSSSQSNPNERVTRTSRSGGLKKLNISQNKIQLHTAMMISDIILHNYTDLEELDLSGNTMSPNVVIDICLKLIRHATLKTITLSGQNINGSYLSSSNTLQLADNKITSADAIALANGIQEIHPTTPLLDHISEVDLSHNSIDKHGAQVLLSALNSYHSLQTVDLQINPIETDTKTQEELQSLFPKPHRLLL